MVSISDEIIVAGCHYGEMSDVILPLYKREKPTDSQDVKNALGYDRVYIMPKANPHVSYAVGVFNPCMEQIGYVWMAQAHAVRKCIEEFGNGYIEGRIKKVDSEVEALRVVSAQPIHLLFTEECITKVDLNWASDLPQVYSCLAERSLGLSVLVMRNELQNATEWNAQLQKSFDNMLSAISAHLSGYLRNVYVKVYQMMVSSDIEEIRRQSDILLQKLIHIESKSHLNWWREEWLPEYYKEVAEKKVVGIYEAAGYSLEKVEKILDEAPEHLFHIYKATPYNFAFSVYFASLPLDIYNRLLTLLAVREAMLAKMGKNLRLVAPLPIQQPLVDLCFFTDDCFASVEGQAVLRGLLQSILPLISSDKGCDFIAPYIAYHYFTGRMRLMMRYGDFFADFESLLPGSLTKVCTRAERYSRYKPYNASLTYECKKWFILDGCLPPMNEWRSKIYSYKVSGERQKWVQDQVSNIIKGFKRLTHQ